MVTASSFVLTDEKLPLIFCYKFRGSTALPRPSSGDFGRGKEGKGGKRGKKREVERRELEREGSRDKKGQGKRVRGAEGGKRGWYRKGILAPILAVIFQFGR